MEFSLKIGIIGGTGLDRDDSILKDKAEISVPKTPYGNASDSHVIGGTIDGVDVIIMARHGKSHNVNPTNVNYRANLWSLKELGCTHILVTTACGSLREEIVPEHVAIVDQYIDRTSKRESSFYTVSHIPQGKPFDESLQQILRECCDELKLDYHPKVTAVTIEGPRFSTLAESRLYQNWGCHIVNMTTVPEAPLAAELGLPYAALALVTDYDCWHETDEHVSVELVGTRMKVLGEKAKSVMVLAVNKIKNKQWKSICEEKQKMAKIAIMSK